MGSYDFAKWAYKQSLLKIALTYENILHIAPREWKDEKEFMLKIIEKREEAFEFASEALQNDRSFVEELVSKNGMILEHARNFRNDIQIVCKAISQNGLAMQFADDRFKKTKP